MHDWPKISEIAKGVQSGKLSALKLVEQSLKKIKLTGEYGAILATIEDRSKKRAAEIDKKVAKGEKIGKLAGVPFVAKDNFLTFGSETTAGSNILKGFKAPYQAAAIERLEEAGAICVAKANMDAFAHGSSTENSDFFVTKNPKDKTRVAGGSSGGSAASVALGIAPFAIGTDTGGSIRLPASFSGVVGIKPTYGLVSRSGVVAMASSTDVIGPLAKTVEDASVVLDIMAGKDELDSTTIERSKEPYSHLKTNLKGKKVGLIKEHIEEGLDAGVRQVVERAIKKIELAGATVSQVSLPSLPLALAAYYIICPAEVSSNLARYDGQRYGYSYKNANDLEQSYKLSREKGFGAEAKRRIMIGTYVLSSGYYDAYYKKAQLVRSKIINELNDVFKNYDLLLGPTAPTTAFKIGDKSDDPLQMYLSDIMTVGANVSGNPAISVPAGETEGMPVGLQFIGPMGGDKLVLEAAKTFEGQK